MITREEWDKLKDSERYGMIANILLRLEMIEEKIMLVEVKK
jgi:hypothetical protein